MKEYVSVKKISNGVMVSVTHVDGYFTSKGQVRTFGGHVKEAVLEARSQAAGFMTEIKEAVA